MRNAIIVLSFSILIAAGAMVWAMTTITSDPEPEVEVMEPDAVDTDEDAEKEGEDEDEDESEEEADEEEDDEEDDEDEEEDEEEESDEDEQKANYTGANYITIDSPENEEILHELPIEFIGVVSPNTTKIIVHASGGEFVGMGIQEIEDTYTLQGFDYGDTSFVYRAKPEWNNLALGTNDYEFTAYFDDGTNKTANVSIYYTEGGAEMGKPVIYLYPEEPMDVAVDVEPNGGFTITEPQIGRDGWFVHAQPNGELYNYEDERNYPYLFWEGYAVDYKIPQEGFVVEMENVSRFFDEKLAYLGMNHREIYDFKEFWVPLMQEDPYYFITFVEQEDFDRYAPLEVLPEPDTVIRVIFDHKGLSEPVEIVEQELEPAVREGFTVVEWGGRLQ